MTAAIQIVFRDLPASATLEESIRRKADRLFRLHKDITSCRITVEKPPAHHHKGGHYHIRVDLHLPGAELTAGRDAAEDKAHENPYVAARDAFRAAKRMLQDHVRKHREHRHHGGVDLLAERLAPT